MEAFLLTLDIAAMVWLCWLVRRSALGKGRGALGWFGYRSSSVNESPKPVKNVTKGPGRA